MSNKTALEALQLAYIAMQHMGNVLNKMDAVDEEEDAQHDAAFEAVSAAIAALEAMEAGGWLPISEAPKDGTVYWATDGKTQREENHPGDGFNAGRWWWNLSYGGWFGAAHNFKATHYRALPPLPTPPKD